MYTDNYNEVNILSGFTRQTTIRYIKEGKIKGNWNNKTGILWVNIPSLQEYLLTIKKFIKNRINVSRKKFGYFDKTYEYKKNEYLKEKI